MSGRAGLEMDKTGKLDRPRMKARLLFNELGFVLDSDQYRDTLMLVDLFHYFIRHQEYKKLQPSKSPKEDRELGSGLPEMLSYPKFMRGTEYGLGIISKNEGMID